MSRTTIRYGAAVVATLMATIYVFIGLGVLRVVDDAPVGSDLFGFGIGAASLFGVGAVLLVAFDRRWLWIGGAILQVLVAAMYVAVSVDRDPPFEVWGILLRLLQLPLFAALVYLSLAPDHRAVAPIGRSGPPRR